MTPPEKPQDPDSRQQADPDSAATMTRAADESATGTSARTSDGYGERGESTTAAGRSDEASTQHSGGEVLDGTDAPPPWQRATSTPVTASDGSTTGVSATSASGSRSSPDVEETQTIPHPLRDTGLGGAGEPATAPPDDAESDAAGSGRTKVAFTGSSGARAGAETSGTTRRPSRGPRRASLQVKRVDPWSVLKLALVLGVAVFFVWLIAVAVLYGVLGGMGVWDQLNGTFTELTQPENSIGEPLISAGRVFGAASIIGAVNIVLITALATVGAFVYNVAAELAGGLEVTLSERE